MAFTDLLGTDDSQLGNIELATNLNAQVISASAVAATGVVQSAAIIGGVNIVMVAVVLAVGAVQAPTVVPGAVTVPANVITATPTPRTATVKMTLSVNAVSASGTVRTATMAATATTIPVSPATATGAVRTANLGGSGVFALTSAGVGSIRPIQVGSVARVMSAILYTRGLAADRATGPITVATILDNLFRQVGLAADQYDVTDATDVVDGFVVSNRAAVKDLIDTLLRVYQVDLIEVDGILKAKKRGEAVVATIPASDLGAKFGGDPPTAKVNVRRLDSLTVPAEGDITYFSVTKEYGAGTQRYSRSTITDVDDLLTVNTNLVLEDTFARQTITRLLFELWVHLETFSFMLTPRYLYLAPGDPIIIPYAGSSIRVRIVAMDVSLFGPIPVEAVLDEVGVLTQTVTGVELPENLPVSGLVLDTNLIAFSTNALRDLDAASVGFYVAVGPATDGEWPGCVLYISQDNGATYQPYGEIADASTYGLATNTLAAPVRMTTGLWDRDRFVDVTITAGTAPSSTSELDVYAGANTVRVGSEVLQFATVTPLGGDSYRLSDLLRGKRGTDAFWSTHGASETVVFLENSGATVRIEVGENLVNKTIKLKAVTAGQSTDDVTPQSLLITGDEYKCYSGSALEGTRSGGDLTISWVRRTRSGGAWADFIDVDLAETAEAYEIDVYSGVSVVRTITGLTSPTTVYTAADQTTDFGSPQTAVAVKVYQLGRYGRGYALEGTI
jgi:hypothetical protein